LQEHRNLAFWTNAAAATDCGMISSTTESGNVANSLANNISKSRTQKHGQQVQIRKRRADDYQDTQLYAGTAGVLIRHQTMA